MKVYLGFGVVSDPRVIQLRNSGSTRGGLQGSKLIMVEVVRLFYITRRDGTGYTELVIRVFIQYFN